MMFYTIGLADRNEAELLDIFKQNGIRAVADLRLNTAPASVAALKSLGVSDDTLARFLASTGIRYVPLPELQNIFLYQASHWQRHYHTLINKMGHLLTDRVYDLEMPFALVCRERSPQECHRIIIADYLVEQSGFEVEHIP